MDYTTQSQLFKLRKFARYTRLYGLSRTIRKVRGQYHMKTTNARLPRPSAAPCGHVGILGCGNFAYSTVAYFLQSDFGNVVRGTMDPNLGRAASLAQHCEPAYYTDNADDVLHDPAIDLVYVTSNHASHAEYAIRALEAGKSVHIEKPHVVNREQLNRLCEAMSHSPAKVALGFNRPLSPIGLSIKRALARETGPGMYNWFVAGHEIEADHWYFDESEGGRILGNLCHWTDFLYHLVPAEDRYPIAIHPSSAATSDSNIVVSLVFADGTIGSITFSAKGHTFEGVRELFAGHRGNVLIAMSDFSRLTIDTGHRKQRIRQLFRDHGHQARIRASYEMRGSAAHAEAVATVDYVWETADLFLSIKDALETNSVTVVERFPGLPSATASAGSAG